MKASRNSAWEGRFRPDGLVHGNEIYDDVGHQVCRSIGCMHELVWISRMDLVVAISDKDSWRKKVERREGERQIWLIKEEET